MHLVFRQADTVEESDMGGLVGQAEGWSRWGYALTEVCVGRANWHLAYPKKPIN
jgi:hypothetical protein